ncbi:MAG: hypothetical protein ACOCNR_06215, partial [Prevotella pectinovora]
LGLACILFFRRVDFVWLLTQTRINRNAMRTFTINSITYKKTLVYMARTIGIQLWKRQVATANTAFP